MSKQDIIEQLAKAMRIAQADNKRRFAEGCVLVTPYEELAEESVVAGMTHMHGAVAGPIIINTHDMRLVRDFEHAFTT